MEYNKETEIMSLLDQMEDLLEEAKSSFMSSKVSIDRDDFLECIKDMRMKLPNELQQSVWIVDERNKILAEAHNEGQLIIQEAQETLSKMIEQHEITKYAEERAQMILENARKDARDIRIGSIEYANETVKVAEQQLKATLDSIHRETQKFENYITSELRILYDHRQELKDMIHPAPMQIQEVREQE
ncbi:hypothetical protein [Niameybacter massiliensis]|uniref:hypothetical protein n=1 Tax=Niameybacter massiliensis TaxID=1658108 RepID=UPI0006B66500|nr:hypothetical protein [Niameybacter massiliensis]